MAKKTKKTSEQNQASSFERLIEIGIALSAEQDTSRLMETILLEAKDISNADGGTLYLKTEDNSLNFEIGRTDPQDRHGWNHRQGNHLSAGAPL